MAMKRITRDLGYIIEWEHDVPEFQEPEVLIDCLERYAPRGTYRIEGYDVWATSEAIRAAVRGFQSES